MVEPSKENKEVSSHSGMANKSKIGKNMAPRVNQKH